MVRRRPRKRKRLRKKKRKMIIPRLLGKSYLTRMRYVTTIKLNPTAGQLSSAAFRSNGITIIEVTGTIGQPTGFDQFMAFFNNYRVLSSTCKMTFVPTSFANAIPGAYGIFLDNNASRGYGSYVDILMGNQSVTKNVRLAGIKNNSQSLRPTTASYNAKRIWGKTAADADQYGDPNVNPTESNFFQCWYGSTDGTNDPGEANFLVQLDYVVLFKDQILTPVSVV